ncbi:hypothetical protein [Prochlorococcus marinus]|uniref:Uncharacterized protein n=1 Tax=Prochlorococcus marinus (strain MIT 9211) TaxID=93059 RepID=A9BEL2_PROM4|nr:hypothetical protein [Prochlorococcus marinus]ABX08522.1 Hypothetical protein P9211_05911 [Prochlorococcus marinus str. MIT 9211]
MNQEPKAKREYNGCLKGCGCLGLTGVGLVAVGIAIPSFIGEGLCSISANSARVKMYFQYR